MWSGNTDAIIIRVKFLIKMWVTKQMAYSFSEFENQIFLFTLVKKRSYEQGKFGRKIKSESFESDLAMNTIPFDFKVTDNYQGKSRVKEVQLNDEQTRRQY